MDILNQLLIEDPEKRISWDNYFNHRFFIIEDKKENNKIEENIINEQNQNGEKNIIYNNGDKYIGDISNNKKEGYGTLFYINGDKYEGAFNFYNQITFKL